MIPKKPSGCQTFRYKSALIFALTSIIPLLLFLLILERYDLMHHSEVALVLLMSVVIAMLGLGFFLQMVKQITNLTEDFLRVERGEIEKVGERDVPLEVSEMARIADAFNKILIELKTNTKELENMIYKLSTLSELTELVSHIPNIKDLLDTVLHQAMKTVSARIGSIMLLDDNNQSLSIAVAEGLEESVVANTTIRLGEGISGKVAQTGEAMLVENMEDDPRFTKTNDPKYETSSFICMPLRAHERIIGVLNMAKKGDQKAFSESDLKFLTALLSNISFAVENARLLKEAKETAIKFQKTVHEKNIQLDQAQQQVLQAAKLSALGELTAGVAHELNNPLTTMMGYSELLLNKVQDGKMARDLKKIFDEAKRAANFVQNLLSFARKEPLEKDPWNINDIVSKALEIQIYDLHVSRIDVTTDLSPELPPMLIHASQLQQVFLNIINNARQAMMEVEHRRKLFIRTEQDGARVKVIFTDNGPGIAPEHLDRIFEPFFTTKAKRKGTGLGLSISYRIVKAHDGDIYVRSQEGEGATFIVELPILLGAPESTIGETPVTRLGKLPIKNILVIDDEKLINDLISDILTEEGYKVDKALGGDQGLRKLLDEEYDLILCDLRMTNITGQRLYGVVKLTKPKLTQRFIFLTGDIVSEESRGFLEETGNYYITKPFTAEILVGVIADAWQQIAAGGTLQSS